ncbi:MAG: isoprenylcysteine carboxylmethyltransferase family protein [Ruminococcus flavefaciens]|nr:isoprenylcysteine carboxylmethyltransferase family protein [Ruminococcus flavefaciens]
MKQKKHLSMYGIGPIYGIITVAFTLSAVILGHISFFKNGIINAFKIPSIILGILLIIFSLIIWYNAMFRAKIDNGIVENRLVTTGIYAFVRNPIYSAIMFICTGVLLISANIYFYPLFFFYWILMTVLLKPTEEKWLKNLYGEEYEIYCRCVNRCIPWFSKNSNECL